MLLLVLGIVLLLGSSDGFPFDFFHAMIHLVPTGGEVSCLLLPFILLWMVEGG